MENKTKNRVVGVIAVVVVALLIFVVVGNSNATGNPIWDFLKAKEGTMDSEVKNSGDLGLLGNAFISTGGDVSSLKGYEAQYDSEGNLLYEITMDKSILEPGEGYNTVQDINDPNLYYIEEQGGGPTISGLMCGCQLNSHGVNCYGSCTSTYQGEGKTTCTGTCSGYGCASTKCIWGWAMTN